ncbi:hypothetical protein [uncultured Adlercreutzia sp.]|uniref:hypothetical protein n=1 Tax=uncultured Adlercreutzia sp. TaxID=875803 RepID=UPI0025F0CD85|nr:hypothetical protein [uncultured Adlercreutzia sp.]
MRIVPYGISALACWITAYSRPSGRAKSDSRVLNDCAPTQGSIAYLHEQLPQIGLKPHVLCSTPGQITRPYCITHTCTYPLPSGSFYPISRGVFLPSPELCIVQLARELPIEQVIFAARTLCSSFAIDPSARSGLSSRKPLTTHERLADYLGRCPGLHGRKAALRALPHVRGCAASPPEVLLSMLLDLPSNLGGFGFSDAATNLRLSPSLKAQGYSMRKTLIPDWCLPSARVIVEYDSDAEHLSSEQALRDATKRLAYEADGYKVITITRSQLLSNSMMRDAAQEIARAAGIRLRCRSARFGEMQKRVYRSRFVLSDALDQGWLRRVREDGGDNER